MSDEIWKPVVGWEDRYEVSDLGRVRSLARLRQYNKGGWRMQPSMIRKTPLDKDGYSRVMLTRMTAGTFAQVHRLVAIAFIPGDCKLQVNHKNGVKTDNRTSNLEWVTNAANQQHRHAVLSQGNGELHHAALLTESTLQEAIKRRVAGESFTDIAESLGLHRTTVAKAVNGKHWRYSTVDRSGIIARRRSASA